jgi:alpha-1,3-glucan synthase
MFGRQPMSASKAWQRHGCYHLGSKQYFNMPLEKSLIGCEDPWNSMDHFDPTAQNRRAMKHFHHLRAGYPSIQDGLNLVQWGNWTHFEQLPGSNMTPTELGMWSASRSPIDLVQKFTTPPETVWMLYTNENQSHTYEYPCKEENWISTPFISGDRIKNLIYPVCFFAFFSLL